MRKILIALPLLVAFLMPINAKQKYRHQPTKVVKLSSARHQLMPSTKVAYLIEGAFLWKCNDSQLSIAFMPKSTTCSRALDIANEFIYRTKLSELYQVPCGTTDLHSNIICYAGSHSKDGSQEIIIGVNVRKRTVWISSITNNQP